MKPFATASKKYNSKYKSADVAMLLDFTKVKDKYNDLNPFFSSRMTVRSMQHQNICLPSKLIPNGP